MASYGALTTSGISTLVSAWTAAEQSRRINPLTTQKTKLSNLVSAWSAVSSKLTNFKSSLKTLSATGDDSIFSPSYSVASSNTSFVAVTSSGELDLSSYSLRVNQLAKNDKVVSASMASGTAVNTLAGTHTLKFQSGDYKAAVDVTLGSDETNKSIMEKIRDAVNSDKYAAVKSGSFAASDSIPLGHAAALSGSFNETDSISSIVADGTHSFDINLNGTTTTVTLDNSAWTGDTTYGELIDQMVSQINSDVTGVTASKVTDSLTGKVQLNIQADNYSDTLTINSDNSNNLLNELGVSADNVKAVSSFNINLNGTTTSIALDNSGWTEDTTYSDVIDQMVSKINSSVSGVTASKVTDSTSGQVSLSIKAKSSSDYLTINSDNSNSLLNTLGISADKKKAASSIISASVFSPTSSTSKLSLSAVNSGYSNRLVISSDSALTQIGLTNDVLTNRYKNTTDGTTTSNTEAGFLYGINWSGGSNSAENEENNRLNSVFSINGITIQRNSNAVSDVVDGLTFSLKSVMSSSDDDVTITESKSNSGIRSKIEDFISGFNGLYQTINNKMYVDVDYGRGIFQGDTSANSLINALRNAATSKVGGLASGSLDSLSKIGIKFNKDAGLMISDSALLDNSIANNLSQVETLFNSDHGVAAKLYSTINTYEGDNGSVYHSITRFNNSIKNINDRITSATTRINSSAEVLRKQYTALQTQLVTVLNMQNSLQAVGLFSMDSTDTSS